MPVNEFSPDDPDAPDTGQQGNGVPARPHPLLVAPLSVVLQQDEASGGYDLTRRAGDTLPEFDVILQDQQGVVDISTATSIVLELMSQQTEQGPVHTSVSLMAGEATGQAAAAWPLLPAGDYQGTVRGTWPDGATASFPDNRSLLILVLADL